MAASDQSKVSSSPSLGAERRWQRDPDWLGAPFDDSLVMLDIASGNYFGLNGTATAIWNTLDEPATAAAIGERLQERFDVAPATCAAAVERTLAELTRMGAIRPA